MSQPSFPSLNGDNRRASLDDVQFKRILQSETNAIVNLKGSILSVRSPDPTGQ